MPAPTTSTTGVGNTLGFSIPTYEGIVPKLQRQAVNLSAIVNNNQINVNGDTITFSSLIIPDVTFTGDDHVEEGCATPEVKCISSQNITQTLTQSKEEAYILNNCRVSLIQKQAANAANVVAQAIAEVELNWMRALTDKLIKNLVSGDTEFTTINTFEASSTTLDVEKRINEALYSLMDMHGLPRENYTVFVSLPTEALLVDKNIECCSLADYINPANRNRFGMSYVSVPSQLLTDDAGVAYEFVIYVKPMYTFYENCNYAFASQGANEYRNYMFYNKGMSYDWYFDSNVSMQPALQNVGGLKSVAKTQPAPVEPNVLEAQTKAMKELEDKLARLETVIEAKPEIEDKKVKTKKESK